MKDLFRIMGIDYGDAHVGIALTDPLQIISHPYKVISNIENNLFIELEEIIQSEKVGKIVIGLPYNLKGRDSLQTLEVRKFANRLKQKVAIPIVFEDERFTTIEANETLKKLHYDIKKSKKLIDMIAASIILKNYLERKK